MVTTVGMSVLCGKQAPVLCVSAHSSECVIYGYGFLLLYCILLSSDTQCPFVHSHSVSMQAHSEFVFVECVFFLHGSAIAILLSKTFPVQLGIKMTNLSSADFILVLNLTRICTCMCTCVRYLYSIVFWL